MTTSAGHPPGPLDVCVGYAVSERLRSAKAHLAYLTLEAPREGQASYAHVFEIVAGLKRLGYTVTLHHPRYTDKASPGLLQRVWEHALLQWALLRNWRLYDLVYVRAHNMAFPTGLAARLTGMPIVHEVNGPHLDIAITYPWTRPFGWLLRLLQRAQYRWASALVPVTEQLGRWLREEGCRCRTDVIPNGANMELFNPARNRSKEMPERYVIFFGGFARWQGIPVMIEAARHPDWPKGVVLVMAGVGQMEAEVRAAAKCGTIRYLGKVPYAEIGGIVAGALAGLVPKTRDDDTEKTGLFPIKLFEILACGVPAIVSDYPGQADLVRTEDCGLVIPPNDPAALAQAVAAIAGDEDRRTEMGKRGHRLIASRHSWQRRAEQTAALIEDLLHERNRA